MRNFVAVQFSNLQSGAVRTGNGCRWQGWGFPVCNLEHGRSLLTGIRFILSGFRGFASVLQNSPDRVPDMLQSQSPAFVSFQIVPYDLKPSEGFLAWGAKNFSQWNINWLRSAKL